MLEKHNPYEPLTKEEIIKREQEKKRIEAKIKAVAEIGSRCLDNSDFKKYREELTKLKEQALHFMAEVSDPDPIKDAFLLRAWINKLDVLYMLLESVEKDSKRRV